MRIIVPTKVTDAILFASSLTENDTDDAPLYNPATSYAAGARVRRAETHKVYESTVAGNVGNTPELNLTGNTPKWIEVRSTNKWAPFDNVVSTQAATAVNTPLTYTLEPGAGEFVDAVSFFNLDATSVRVQLLDSGGVSRYDKTIDLRSKFSKGWRDYFFKKVVRKRDVVFMDLPLYANPQILITITKTNSIAKVGDIIIGRATELGELQWAPEVRIIDYSRKDTDAFGNTKFTKRRNAKLLTCALFIENELFDEVRRIVAEYTSTPLAWVGDEQYGSTIVFGFCRDFRAVLASPAGSEVSLEIEGLV